MRIVLLALAIIAMLGIRTTSAAPLQPMSTSDTDEVRQATEAWLNAYKVHDVALVEALLADDFVGVLVAADGTPVVLNKAEILRGVADVSTKYKRIETANSSVHILGGVGVACGTSVFEGERSSGSFRTVNRYCDVYEKRDGKWKAVSMHLVRVG